jgi:hypothetical protein
LNGNIIPEADGYERANRFEYVMLNAVKHPGICRKAKCCDPSLPLRMTCTHTAGGGLANLVTRAALIY